MTYFSYNYYLLINLYFNKIRIVNATFFVRVNHAVATFFATFLSIFRGIISTYNYITLILLAFVDLSL